MMQLAGFLKRAEKPAVLVFPVNLILVERVCHDLSRRDVVSVYFQDLQYLS